MERRAKIVATLGPASSSDEVLTELLKVGLDVVRLNLSHGTREDHRENIRRVRRLARAQRRHVPIIVDLMGPRYRLGQIPHKPTYLQEGQQVALGAQAPDIDLPVEDPDFLDHLQPGERILIDNGLVELKVVAREGQRVTAEVIAGGPVATRKGINLPETDLPFTITDKDRGDIALAVEEEVDFLAVSFVGGPEDLDAVRQVVTEAGSVLPLIAKLERGAVVRRIEETVQAADAVMVARGDLGVEVPLHRVPVLQKQIIAAGRKYGKPVIVATQMLESMMEHPRPTRAESSDVANAVFDSADGLMLSGETAAGDYPVEAVQTMAEIICEAEAYRLPRALPVAIALEEFPHPLLPGLPEQRELNAERDVHLEIPDVIAAAAVYAAGRLEVRQLVAFSQSGFTARTIARYRPQPPIIVFTRDEQVARRVQLVWGTRPVVMASDVRHHDEVVDVVDRLLQANDLASPGDTIIILMGDPISDKALTNLMRLHRVRATG